MTLPAIDHARFVRARWTVFWLLVGSYIMVYFHRMAPGVVSADLMEAFGTTGAALGSLAATYYYIYTAMQIPSGVLADTLGPRVSVAAGGLVAGAGSILFGLADDFASASWGRFLVGLGVSVVFVGLMKSNAVWFSERQYGRISGLTLLIGNLGSILAAGPLALLLTGVSWRQVFIGAGIASLALAGLTLLLVRNRPEDAGFQKASAQILIREKTVNNPTAAAKSANIYCWLSTPALIIISLAQKPDSGGKPAREKAGMIKAMATRP